MPKMAAELSAIEVKALRHAGKARNRLVSVGGVSGLLLQIARSGGRSWILRTIAGGKRRNIGLGGYPDVTLAQAREAARAAKAKIRDGIDPVAERRAKRAALAAEAGRGLTFAEAVERALAAKLDAFSNEKHRDQWASTLKTYALPVLGKMRVDAIAVQDVLRVLQPIWTTKTETATRVRGRIEAVLSWATVSGHRAGDNPARWAGNLKELLPAPEKVAKAGNHPALSLEDLPRWMAALRAAEGMGARAVEFAALTAARSGEVRGAVWAEVDLERALWTIPAERMKMGREHRVPLSREAVALLAALPRFAGSEFVFPAQRGGALSDMTLSGAMRRLHAAAVAAAGGGDEAAGFLDPRSKRPAVPHGLRSAFRDWVAERTTYAGEMAEVALAHRIASAVEAAYRRGDMVEKRRHMMQHWAEVLGGVEAQGENVVRLG